MSSTVTLGGDRLGAGKKNKIHLHGYERSSHDLGFIGRTTMAPGTLVPFMAELGLPGDTFDINLNGEAHTLPTLGPLFGSFKYQMDVFVIPIRLYQGALKMNQVDIGMDMKQVRLPQMILEAAQLDKTKSLDNQQIDPSCILAYFDIRGLGHYRWAEEPTANTTFKRAFSALKWLMYWDIYKQYYSNKQEEIGAFIHNPLENNEFVIGEAEAKLFSKGTEFQLDIATTTDDQTIVGTTKMDANSKLILYFDDFTRMNIDSMYMYIEIPDQAAGFIRMTQLFAYNELNEEQTELTFSGWYAVGTPSIMWNVNIGQVYIEQTPESLLDTAPQVKTFPLKNIDNMKKRILTAFETSIQIDGQEEESPYKELFHRTEGSITEKPLFSKQSAMEGLGLKTYQSDVMNNWLSTEWLDGDNGVNAITAVQVSEDGTFTLDQFNLQRKLYNLMNRIAVSGGTYDDWQSAVWDSDGYKNPENPIYIGGLSKEIVFQEVVSNNSNEGGDPLGSLAGRGVMSKKHKGGEIYVKITEPSYIIGIQSLTPRVDYSQGNKWDNDLKTMDDFHKPALDEIGFQDLITDTMAFWDTTIDQTGGITYRSVGKQPAWINYMTNVNRTYGNFAKQNDQMFMTLNRRYEPKHTEGTGVGVRLKDATTYIDPSKFNHIFADARLDAQNFWIQWSVDMTARRKMSAKVMPNL